MTSHTGLPEDTATLYRLQVRGMRDYAMFLMDVSGTILTWNKGVEALLGYSEAEFVGKQYFDHFHAGGPGGRCARDGDAASL